MNIDVAVAIVVCRTTGDILIARRAGNAHLGGYWEFPGGKVEPGETAEQCALRETLEETGVVAKIDEAWPPVIHGYPERTVRLFPFLAHSDDAGFNAPDGAMLMWAPPATLADYPFPSANKDILTAIGNRAWDSLAVS